MPLSRARRGLSVFLGHASGRPVGHRADPLNGIGAGPGRFQMEELIEIFDLRGIVISFAVNRGKYQISIGN
jgi:hypothetical protein